MTRSTNTSSGTARRGNPFGRAIRSATAGMLALAACGTAQAFPSLDLVPGTPDIVSSFITVDYAGNNAAGTLTASGFANVLTPPGSPGGNISGGSFDLNAQLSFDSQTADGTLNIGGTIAGLGFNSGTLLTGVFTSSLSDQRFGAGTGDPLEFLFDVTGGDAAGLFGGIGATAGVILSNSGYSGAFDLPFSSGAFQALADTFATPVDAPGTLVLMLGGGALLGLRRRRRRGSA